MFKTKDTAYKSIVEVLSSATFISTKDGFMRVVTYDAASDVLLYEDEESGASFEIMRASKKVKASQVYIMIQVEVDTSASVAAQ